ncbi:MAG: SPOR domain-containing protein [Gemmatimonadales bacterium]
MQTRTLLVLLLLSTAGCGPDRAPDRIIQDLSQPSGDMEVGASVAFRLPHNGGDAKLYRLPEMSEVSWEFDAGPRPILSIVGFARDKDLVLSLVSHSAKGGRDFVALDLVTGRSRTLDTSIALATIGPTGQTSVVRADGVLGEVDASGRIDEWSDTLSQIPTHLWGALRDRIVATVSDSAPELLMLAEGQDPIRQRIPRGAIAISRWGRFVVVATDSGLATFDPADPGEASFIRTETATTQVVLSPSAHRIYAVQGANELVSFDRFQPDERNVLVLPGPIGALRMDPFGRILLAESQTADSIWIVDLAGVKIVGTVSADWDSDLPAVAPDGGVLVRRGDTVRALEPGTFESAQSLRASRADRWMVTAWDPRRPALELASDSVARPEQAGQIMYVQVSSSRNPAWAEDFARELRDAGMNASVLQPDSAGFAADELFRVVLGPYTSRAEAELAGKKLGRPFFIITREVISPESIQP